MEPKDSVTDVLNGSDPASPVHADIYRELRSIAIRQLRDGRATGLVGPWTGTTSLIGHAAVKLARTPVWDSRRHFYGSAAHAMRQVLIGLHRAHVNRLKRESEYASRRPKWSENALAKLAEAEAMDRALRILHSEHPDAAAVAELWLYAGLKTRMISEALGFPVFRVQRLRKFAAARLRQIQEELESDRGPEESDDSSGG